MKKRAAKVKLKDGGLRPHPHPHPHSSPASSDGCLETPVVAPSPGTTTEPLVRCDASMFCIHVPEPRVVGLAAKTE